MYKRQFLNRQGLPILQVCQAPYSHDRALSDFWCVCEDEEHPTLKGSCFESLKEIMQNTMAQLAVIPKKPVSVASSEGKTAGLSLWNHKGPTLKGVRSVSYTHLDVYKRQYYT